MNRVAEFEKVSFDEFYQSFKNMLKENGWKSILPEDAFKETIYKIYKNITIPERATIGSAGYDIKSPIDVELPPKVSFKIPTGIRVKIDDGWVLAIVPRSGLGFKYRMQLDNTVGIIDSDYYNSDNEGHIFIKITNDTYADKTLVIDRFDRIAQGIFLPYGITYSDNATGKRNGGFGSTGKNTKQESSNKRPDPNYVSTASVKV